MPHQFRLNLHRKGGDFMLQKQKKDNNLNPIMTAAAGAVVGAGVVVAATSALKNPKTREKIMSTLENVKDQAMDKIPQVVGNKNVDEAKKVGKKIGKKVEKVKKTAKSKSAPVVIN